jgi:hypothetical protein
MKRTNRSLRERDQKPEKLKSGGDQTVVSAEAFHWLNPLARL